jgi:baseplate J-like protein
VTVETAPARRTVIDLGGDATILDAARRLDAAESSDVVLVVPSGAPLTRNAVFLETLLRRAGDRRIVLVSPEARARSLASSVHMKAFASISALDRHEMDATEHLTDARRAAMSTRVQRRAAPRRGSSPLRALAVFLSLVTAAGILLAVVGPSATIVIAATPTPLGPFEYDLRAGPNGGDISAETKFEPNLMAKTTGTATGTKPDEVKAAGKEKFSNATTNDIRIPVGTVVQTTDSPPVRFVTTEEKILPRSSIFPPAFGTVLINIQAVEVGPKGNVAADKITRGPSLEYLVTNPAATTGGKADQIPVVTQADYDKAVSQSDADVQRKAEQRAAEWQAGAPSGTKVYGVVWKRTSVVTPASDVVGKQLTKETPTFEITVTGNATAYAVSDKEPTRTAIAKLADEVAPGMDLDETSPVVNEVIGASVRDDGVHWRVRAQGKQKPQPKTTQMTAALVGREFKAVGPVAEQQGFTLRSVTPWPDWWPLLPVLDSRITIVVESLPPAASSP